MHIVNVEALKAWLARTAAPICDADPATFAKYVLALIRKEKSEPELRHICLSELEAFLNTKTAVFVELLFLTLKDGSYETQMSEELPLPVKELSVAMPHIMSSFDKTNVENSKPQKTTIPSGASISAVDVSSRNDQRDWSRINDRRNRSGDRNLTREPEGRGRSHRTPRNEGDRRTCNSRRINRRSRHHSCTRSRERGNPTSRRLGYRSDPKQCLDLPRGKSYRHSRDDRTYRRRSHSRRVYHRSRSRTRSRSRVRSPPRVYLHMRTYSRLRSKTRSRSQSLSLLPTPSSPNAARPTKRVSRSRSSEGRDENAYRITLPLDVVLSKSSAAVVERAHVLKVGCPDVSKPPPSKARCQDYDEQGFCLLGNLCPYDHGVDPVIIEDVNLPVPAGLVTFPGRQPASVRARAPIPHSVAPLRPVVLMGPQLPLVAPSVVPVTSSSAPLMDPLRSAPARVVLPGSAVLNPTYCMALRVKSSAETEASIVTSLPPAVSLGERNVIPVFPKNPADGKRIVIPVQREASLAHVSLSQPKFAAVHDTRCVITQPGRCSLDQNLSGKQLSVLKKHIFDPSRLGRRISAITSNNNATLELAGIPTHLNTISTINREFCKYGTLVNIQVYYNGLADHALVSFAQSAEASAAFHSSEPIFNNRFVSVSWHSAAKQVTVPEVRKVSVRERLGTKPTEIPVDLTNVHEPFANSSPEPVNDTLEQQSDKKVIILSPSGALTKTVFNKQMPSNMEKHTENKPAGDLRTYTNHNDLTKEQMKVRLEINHQKQLIMKKHVEKQKALLLKLESHYLSAEERKSTIEMIKGLENQVHRMISDLNNSTKLLNPLVKKLQDRSAKTVVNHFPLKHFASHVEIQKSILDTELDLIAKETQGIDATELKKKLAILSYQATTQDLAGSRRCIGKPFRDYGGLFARRGQGQRDSTPSAAKLFDRRPKQLLVSGFSLTSVGRVMAALSKFSGMENMKYLPENNYIVVAFHSRHDAEKAAVEGLIFKDQNLMINWFDDRKPTKVVLGDKKHEEIMIGITEEMTDVEENFEPMDADRKFSLGDSESEVELIVEDDDDYRDEEQSNSVTVGFDEDDLDESELLKLDDDDNSDINFTRNVWHR